MEIEIPNNLRLFKLSAKTEIIIFMIREDLKSRKLFNGLSKVGFDSTTGFDLSTLILSLAGFQDRSDELYDWYFGRLDHFAEKFELDDSQEFNNKAFDLYVDMVIEKRRRDQKRV